ASDDSLIGTDSGVTSGERASITWSDLSNNTQYEWYAVADDGTEIAQSETWSFTTGEVDEENGVNEEDGFEIPGYNPLVLLGVICVISAMLLPKLKKNNK
ncbi:MAG: hypothetical protein R6U96_16560, partial [Promethearchaeia archaeon]